MDFSVAGYYTQGGFMGRIPAMGWVLFSTENDYLEYIRGLSNDIRAEQR